MSYLKSDGADAIVEWPYSYAQLRRDNPDVSFPREVDDAWLNANNIFKVTPSAQPAYDLNKNVVEAQPQRINGEWVQVWAQVNATLEEIVARVTKEQDEAENDEIRSNPEVAAFIAMTPAELDTFIDNLPNTVAAMKSLNKRIAKMLLGLSKKVYR
jgi:hypothetical protein